MEKEIGLKPKQILCKYCHKLVSREGFQNHKMKCEIDNNKFSFKREQPKEVLCKHCQNYINQDNYQIHEVRCQMRQLKNSQISSKNKSVLIQERQKFNPNEKPKSSIKKQCKSEYKPRIFTKPPSLVKKQEQERIPCPNCGYNQTLAELDTHPQFCKNKENECINCGQSYPSQLMEDHLQVCEQTNRNHINYEEDQNHDFEQEDPFSSFFRQIHSYNNRGNSHNSGRGMTYIHRPGQGTRVIIGNPRDNNQYREEEEQSGRRPRGNPFLNFLNLIQLMANRQNGPQNQGLTKDEIKTLPKTRYQNNKEEKDLCTICYCDFEDKEQIMTLKCKHIYHPQCIVKWLQQNGRCPVCKKPQTERSLENQEQDLYE